MNKDLLDNSNTERKPTEGGGKDRKPGRNTEKLSKQLGNRLGKLKPW